MAGCKKGFTLVELMVVIAIVGIMTAIAVPFFFSAEQRIQKAARGLMGDINKTKSLAIRTNSPHRLVIGSSGYEIQDASGTTLTAVPLTGYASGIEFDKGSAVDFPLGGGSVAEDITDATNDSAGTLTFDYRGLCNQNVSNFDYGFVYLKFKNIVYAVGVNLVGHVTIKRWNGSAWV